MTDNEQSTKLQRLSWLILGSTAIVIGAATVLFVLPAETGFDPTGFGKATGLVQIANPEASKFLERGKMRNGVLTSSVRRLPAEPGVQDNWTYDVPPYGEIELKYKLDKGAAITFSWEADGPLNYDMHAHPFDGGEELTESYVISKDGQQMGRYVAAFSGIHGWHWQNRGLKTVRITLQASGKIAGSLLISGPEQQERSIVAAAK